MKFNFKNLSSVVTLINILLASIIGIFIAKINSLYHTYELKVQNLFDLRQELVDYTKTFEKEYNAVVSIYIKDIKTQYRIEINSDIPFPAASVIKIPIMAAVYHLAEKGELSLDEILVYNKKHRCGGSGVIKNLPYGEKFKIRKLVELMITISDNVATHMLIDRIGLNKLNKTFKELGLKNTILNRYVMDLKSRQQGKENYTTAEEIGELLEKIYKGKLVSKEASSEMLKFLLEQKITDRLPSKLPPQAVVAHKTGLMRDLCHDTGIVFTRNGDFIICVLTKTTNKPVAKNFIAEVAFKTYCAYNQPTLQYDKTNKNEITYGPSNYSSRSDTRDY